MKKKCNNIKQQSILVQVETKTNLFIFKPVFFDLCKVSRY